MTDQTLNELEAKKVPDNVRASVGILHNKNFVTESYFLGALQDLMSEEDYKKYRWRILQHTEIHHYEPNLPEHIIMSINY